MNNKMYKLMNWPAIEAIVYAESDRPGDILGPHVTGSSTLYQAYIPDTKEVRLRIPAVDKSIKMEQVDENGYYAALVPGKTPVEYEYIAEYLDGHIVKIYDAYKYTDKTDLKLLKDFALGKNGKAYEVFGAHVAEKDNMAGVVFTIWAPNARRVSVMGDFNSWDGRIHQMNRVEDTGIFNLFVPGAKLGDNYYYEINTKSGLVKTVIDPYSPSITVEDGWYKSVVSNINGFKWSDDEFLKQRDSAKKEKSEPVSIYECDLAMWWASCGTKDYLQLGEKIAAHVSGLGYTHIELKPIAEYEIDESKGYETVGYFAPTSRYGSPEQFAGMIDLFHKEGIKVILDWTLAHPSSANYALRRLDGTACYEHEDPRQGIQPQWGTLLFNYGRGEVVSFLKSNALYWLEVFHLDGLRIDSLASVICLDYGRNYGDWVPNMYGGHENLEALEFIKDLNSTIEKKYPGVITIAEDSSAWPKVTEKVANDGLGFSYKWNIGWRDDYLRYISKDPLFRGGSHNDLTLSMVYAYSDRFVLPLNVSEIEDAKLSLAYMMTHPGIKLVGSGLDIAIDKKNQIDKLVKALNQFYIKHPALYELDDVEEGFEWINCMDATSCTLSFIRKGSKASDTLVVVANFAGIDQDIDVGVSVPGKYTRVFNSDATTYGGASKVKENAIYTIDDDVDGRPYYIPVSIPALSLSIFSYNPFDKDDRDYMLSLHEEAKRKADEAKSVADKEELKAKAAQKKAEAEEKKAKAAAQAAEEARIRAEEEYKKAEAEMEKAYKAMEKAKEAVQKAEMAAHRLRVTEQSMK